MANEATIRQWMTVLVGDNQWSSPRPSSFQTDVASFKGPVPGVFTVTIAGIDVDLSELTIPGLCQITNLDSTNYVNVGIWDPETGVFYPLAEVRAGETWCLRLSRNLFGEYGTGPGTSGANTNTLRIKADTASCSVVVEAFEA